MIVQCFTAKEESTWQYQDYKENNKEAFKANRDNINERDLLKSCSPLKYSKSIGKPSLLLNSITSQKKINKRINC